MILEVKAFATKSLSEVSTFGTLVFIGLGGKVANTPAFDSR